MPFHAERFTGVIMADPGENRTPDHGYAKPSFTSPVMCSAFLLPSAPPATTSILATDFPPAMASVDSDQPAPNFACGAPSCSKSLIQPDSEPAGGGAVRCFP